MRVVRGGHFWQFGSIASLATGRVGINVLHVEKEKGLFYVN